MSDKYKKYCISTYFRKESISVTNGECMQKVLTTLAAAASPLPSSAKLCEPMHEVFSENPFMKTIYDPGSIAFCHYQFPLDDAGYRKVEEIMLESHFSFLVPIQYLTMLLDCETQRISALESIGNLTQSWEVLRQEKLKISKQYFDKYRSRLEFLKKRYQAPFFKKSTNKTIVNLDFVPVNLHLQRFRVDKAVTPTMTVRKSCSNFGDAFPTSSISSGGAFIDYDVITVGATANHSMGFKHGGLLEILTGSDDYSKSRKNPFDMAAHLSRNQPISSEEMLLERITTLHSQVKGRIEELKTLLSSNNTSTGPSISLSENFETSLSSLRSSVNSFLDCCESQFISTCITSLNDARPAYKPLYPETSTMMSSPCYSNNLVTVSSIKGSKQKSGPSLKQFCEEVRDRLSDVSKSFQFPQTDSLENFLRGEFLSDLQSKKVEECLPPLQNAIETLFSSCVSALSFEIMKQDRKSPDPETVYRRHSVFSQALALCACAVTTLMTSSLHSPAVLEQFSAVGILLQIESLLSTYGSEMGMIQDYAVGTSDLCNVTFRCVQCAGEVLNEGTNTQIDDFLPSIQGTLNAPTIILPFDEPTFRLLPNDLQQGQLIKVYPVMFNVGINEEQTIAHRLGDTALQEHLNADSFKKLSHYCSMVQRRCTFSNETTTNHARSDRSFYRSTKHSSRKPGTRNLTIDGLLLRLNSAIKSRKHKNVEILDVAFEICRIMNGARVISCKSAKDRTAMGVTLSQAQLLRDHHSLAPNVFMDALNCMRSEGTRSENTMKNTGRRLYAFSYYQLKTFPKLYRPPEGTYGKGET